jgi:hypothetical protein
MAGTPIIFWVINYEDLVNFPEFSEGITILHSPENGNGDECHYDIIIAEDTNDKKAKKFSQTYNIPPHIYLCCKGELICISSKEQYENLEELIHAC